MNEMGFGEDDDLLALPEIRDARIDIAYIQGVFPYYDRPAHLEEEAQNGVLFVHKRTHDRPQAMEIDEEEIADVIPEGFVVAYIK